MSEQFWSWLNTPVTWFALFLYFIVSGIARGIIEWLLERKKNG